MRRRTSWFWAFRFVFLASVAWFGEPGVALGTTYDTSPRPTVLLKDSKRFIAQDSWNSLALYRVGDATPIHRFPASERVNKIAVTSDEKRLLIACSDGSVAVWEVETGKRLWEQTGKQSGLNYAYDASFAQDGKSCIVCDEQDQAIVFTTATGERLGVVQFPPKQTKIKSAALCPDGSSGVLIDAWDRLYTFDVATGTIKDTGIKGAWPVRFSVDGKHVAFRSENSGVNEKLRVVSMDGKFTTQDIGAFSHIGHIKPTDDGAFLAMGRVGDRHDEKAVLIGVRVRQGNKAVEELWKRPWSGVDIKTDFRPDSMIGVSTDASLVTTVTDLRTGALLQEVDNRANSRPEMMSYSSTGVEAWHRRSWWRWAVVVGGLVMATTAILVWRQVRRRRMARKSGNAGSAI